MAVGLRVSEAPSEKSEAPPASSSPMPVHHHGYSPYHPTVRAITGPLVRPLVLAAAISGVVEILLHRIVVPLASHIPAAAGRDVGEIAQRGADAAVGATAMLATAGAIAFTISAWTRRPAIAALLLVATTSTTVVVLGSEAAAAFNHAAVIACAVAVTVFVLASAIDWHGLAVAVIGAGLVAGQWPLLADYAWGGETLVTARSVAEMALLLAPALLAIWVFREQAYPKAAFWFAAAGGLATAVVLSGQGEYSAIVSLWAVGATLSFPPLLYVVAAACVAFVLAAWLEDHTRRHMAAGLALLAVAGLQPAVVHHNVTALVAFVLLASPLWPADPWRPPDRLDQV